jgi:pimeloyl-ACP methyl ester carboxylesterase
VLAPAAPGFGDSPFVEDADFYRPTRLANLVPELATHFGLESFAFVGWSWGASIGVHLAAADSARLLALVLLDAGHTTVEALGTREELERAFVEDPSNVFESWDALFEWTRTPGRSWRPELEARVRAGATELDDRVTLLADPRAGAWSLWGVAIEPPIQAFELLTDEAPPILLVRSRENDDADDLRRFREALPAAEVVTIDSGHDLLADAPDATHELVASWLRRTLG